MKAILKFNLPDDQKDLERAFNADKMAEFMWDFQQYLRAQVKYGDPPHDAEKIYSNWFEMLGKIDLEDLVM